jgi:uncharacterized protein YgiM (DUF1202 family)
VFSGDLAMILRKNLLIGLCSVGAVMLAAMPGMARPATLDTTANVRSAASLQAPIEETLSKGAPVEVMNIVLADDGNHWYYVISPIEGTASGWVRSDLVRFKSNNLKYGTLTGDRGDKINVRSGPGIDRRILHHGLSGDLVTVGRPQYDGYDGDMWYEVKFPNGSAGWVREDLVSVWPKGCIITCPDN